MSKITKNLLNPVNLKIPGLPAKYISEIAVPLKLAVDWKYNET